MADPKSEKVSQPSASEDKKICGIVRPISPIGDYTAQHWNDVAEIIEDVVRDAGLQPNLVSEANSTGIIHARIVQNLYANPVVICDISGKNPNVMLELGLRLAFDKPVIVIKDDDTDYSFDTSPIEHVIYPRSLHYGSILRFLRDLKGKLQAAIDGEGHSHSFLRQFGPIKVAEIDQERVPGYEILRDELNDLKSLISAQMRDISYTRNMLAHGRTPISAVAVSAAPSGSILFTSRGINPDRFDDICRAAVSLSAIDKVTVMDANGEPRFRVKPNSMDGWTREDAKVAFRELLDSYRSQSD